MLSYLAKNQKSVVPHPPYSPDLAPADFSCRFQTTEETQENAIREPRAITEGAFQEAFEQRKKRWERRIASRGYCFEGDSA